MYKRCWQLDVSLQAALSASAMQASLREGCVADSVRYNAANPIVCIYNLLSFRHVRSIGASSDDYGAAFTSQFWE